MKSRFSPRQIVTAVALSIGLTASAFAMPPQGEGPGQPSGMHSRHMAQGMKEMTRLHDDLKLNAKQEALWQEAEKTSKEGMNGMHERFTKHHEEIKALLSKPGADLRDIAKRMDEFKAEGQKQREANRDRWLAVYDTLNAEQKEQARVFFKSKFEQNRHFGKRDAGKN
ncbi:MAG: periplasmic heavy metal sensor [Betaproteobacteria bacterium]